MTENLHNRKIVRDGPHVTEVSNILAGEIKNQESLSSISRRAIQIIENSVDPIAGLPESGTAEHENDGLLYGLIQSGKTSIITVAAAMAADNGFQCVVVLTSDIDVLYEQTLERVRRALPGLNVLGKNDWRDAQRFERQLRTPPFVIVCSKNGRKLSGLLEAFKAAGARGLSAMIIDDEADQASLNTYTSKGGEQVSRVNEVITDFRNFFQVNTYLQVTATPQALFLQRPDGLYRPSFTVLSEPGPGYVGGEAFFEPESKLLRYVDLDEVDQLRASHQPAPTGTVPLGLRRALLSFLVAGAAEKIRNPTENYAFLCHVSVNTADHKHIVNLLDRFKEETMNALNEASSRQHERLIEDLKKEYGDLLETQPGLPPFDRVVEKIKFYLHGANIKLVNALSNEEIKLDSVYNIFIGGNKLGRGVTIKNLLTSYYGRNPKRPNSDTVLQHARMYGYRQNAIGITRLFLPEKLAEHFKLIHQMENALRELVAKHPKGKFEGIYISSPLRATRPNVLDPNSIGMYVAGGSYNPSYPLRTGDTNKNTDWLDAKLSQFGDQSAGQQVAMDFVIELLEKCKPDPKYGIELWDQKTLKAALEKLKTLKGDMAYIVVRKNRDLKEPRRETRGILSGGEEALAPKDAPTLFIYRQNEVPAKGESAVWWPQLRFPEGNYVMAFSFNR
jgi:Z1 domain